MPRESVALVWFRRDLRLADHRALSAAVERAGRVVCVYVHAPDEDGEWRPGAASNWWLHHSLAELDADLRGRGGALTLRRGPTAEALAALAAECGATQVYWHRLHEPHAAARDRAVERTLRERGLDCESFAGAYFHEPDAIAKSDGGPFRVFTPYWRASVAQLDGIGPPLPAPARLRGPAAPLRSDALASLRLLPRVRWDDGLAANWAPGEAGAHARLEAFCASALDHYAEGRDRPDLPHCSRLSPHLHFGELSPRQCLAAIRNTAGEGSEATRQSADAFLRELGWRDFAAHLLHHFPHTATRPLDERFERFPWRTTPQLLEAWQRGRTGIPLIDAGMRELWHTGWMHNRVRMLVASLLTKNLQQPWLEGARWFWDTLVDADLASNTLGWQWTAGCGADAAPFFRIFNPVLQAERCDPLRAYLRRWLPELARLPDDWIHRPWEAPPLLLAEAGVRLGADYPWPVVDLGASRKAALAAHAGLREPPRHTPTSAG